MIKKKILTPHGRQRMFPIELIHKSQNVLVPYPTMLHSEQKYAHFCSEWSIVWYGTDDNWDFSIFVYLKAPLIVTIEMQAEHVALPRELPLPGPRSSPFMPHLVSRQGI